MIYDECCSGSFFLSKHSVCTRSDLAVSIVIESNILIFCYFVHSDQECDQDNNLSCLC